MAGGGASTGALPPALKDKSLTALVAPLISVFLILVALFNVYSTAAGQLVIRRFCLDLNLPETCNADEALNGASRLSMISLVLGGLANIVFVGIYGAIGNRLGRKRLMALSICGMGVNVGSYTAIYLWPDLFGSSWKAVIIIANVLSFSLGGVLVMYIALFGSIGDISTRKPELRMILYVVLDIIAGVAGICGVQVAAVLLKHDPRIVTTGCSIGFVLLVLFTLAFLNETIDPALQTAPIQWSKANVFGQLAFILPTKSAHKTLNKDFEKVYEKLVNVYNAQLDAAEGIEPGSRIPQAAPYMSLNDGGDQQQQHQQQYDDVDDDNHANNNNNNNNNNRLIFTRHLESSTSTASFALNDATAEDGMQLEIATEQAIFNGIPVNYDGMEYANGINNTLFHDSPAMTPMASPMKNGDLPPSFDDFALSPPAKVAKQSSRAATVNTNPYTESLLAPEEGRSDDINNNNNIIFGDEEQQQDDNTENNKEEKIPTLPKLKFASGPPRFIKHSNAMIMLTFCIFFYIVQFFGQKVCDLFYIKKVFSATSQDYSNLLTIQAIVRGLGSFLLVPLLRRFIKTPNHERLLLAASLLAIAASLGVYPLCKTYWQYCLLSVFCGLASTLPSGLVRSLMSNQVTNALQGQVLSAISSAEVFVFVAGGLAFNLIWIETSKVNAGIIYYVCAAISVIAAACPMFIMDSSEDFNLRINMTTQFTKYELAEKKRQEYFKKQLEKTQQQQQIQSSEAV